MSTSLYDGAIRTCSLVEAKSFIEQLFSEESSFGRSSSQSLSQFWNAFGTLHPKAWDNILDKLHQTNSEEDIERARPQVETLIASQTLSASTQ